MPPDTRPSSRQGPSWDVETHPLAPEATPSGDRAAASSRASRPPGTPLDRITRFFTDLVRPTRRPPSDKDH